MLFQKLDYEQSRLEIKEQLDRINSFDKAAAIATAMQRGILTSNRINKLIDQEQQVSRKHREKTLPAPVMQRIPATSKG